MKYSKLPRLYIDQRLSINSPINSSINSRVEIHGENQHYITKVMRARSGDEIRVFNERDGEYFGRIEISGKTTSVSLVSKLDKAIDHKKTVTLILAVIKPERFEVAIDMATQLGIKNIIPMTTERSQKKDLNYERLGKIILEATRQCERLDIPALHQAIGFADIRFQDYDHVYFANENENNTQTATQHAKNIAIIVGPEGGFTDAEIEYVKSQSNATSVSLGQNVLRSETAAVSLISRVLI